jgi:AmmeMemoRadiSam system protein B
MNVRPSSFAGSWYPRSATACQQEIDRYLTLGIGRGFESQPWLGGIVPHAGWYYSGSVAAGVVHLLKETPAPDIVVVFGMHLRAHSPNVMMAEGAWETPLGHLPVAAALARDLRQHFDFQLETPQHFIPDNTVEVQLPFIKYLLDPLEVLALGIAPGPRSVDIGRAVAQWGIDNGKRIKIIGSTDLTHYGSNYDYAPHGEGPQAVAWVRDVNDRRVIDAMLAMDAQAVLREGVGHRNACCAGAVSAAIAAVRQLGAVRAQLVAYTSSYEKSPGDSFVGYAGVVFGQ